jgi:hypothetical protein
MNIQDFYSLDSIYLKSNARLSSKELSVNEDLNGLFDEHRLIMGTYNNIEFPIKFVVEKGKKYEDLLDTFWVSLFLISDNFKNILEENSLTGWKAYPITIIDKKGVEISGYHGFSITGRSGSVDFKKSEIIEKQHVPNAPKAKYYKGLYVGLNKWDGSDFFLPESYFGIIISSKAANIINENKLTNIKTINLADVETLC